MSDVLGIDDSSSSSSDDEEKEQGMQPDGNGNEGTESSSSSSSSSGSDSEDEDEENQKKLFELRDALCTNPFDYDTHIKLISLLRSMGELEGTREAREKMNEKFPLTPTLWLEWIADERLVATTSDEDNSKINDLYDRATKDYVSVDVCLDYISFALVLLGSPNGITEIRNAFEKCLTQVGLHIAKGSLVWDSYRDFEMALLETMTTDEEKIVQTKRIYDLFKRQLSVPLTNMEETIKKFRDWFTLDIQKTVGTTEKDVKYVYDKALSEMKKFLPFEDSLKSSAAPHIKEYSDYIDFVETNANPSVVQNVYERALVENCLDAQLWDRYLNFLNKKLPIEDVVKIANERAVRNCPWSSAFWVSYIVALETYGSTKEQVMFALEKSLVAGLPSPDDFLVVWTAYLDCVRRKTNFEDEKDVESLRKTFNTASTHLISIAGDANFSVLHYLARIEAKHCKSITNARTILDELFAIYEVYSQSQSWLDYYQLELLHGDETHAKKVLLRGLQSNCDWPETIGNVLLRHERDEGTLETYLTAKEKYKTVLEKVLKKREQASASSKKSEKALKSKDGSSKPAVVVQRKRKLDKTGSNTALPGTSGEFKVPSGDVPHKKPRVDSVSEASTSKPLNFVKPKDIASDSEKNLQTVFVSNLEFGVPEDVIKDKFLAFGEITDFRYVRNYKGAFKGFCYIEYSTIESARTALKNDRLLVSGRPAYVSEIDKKKEFGFNNSQEKDKIFVRNLSSDADEELLRTVFSKFGALKDVRLVRYRNGHPKGCAYIVFTNEQDAQNALQANGTLVKDKNIEVAISDPQRGSSKASRDPSQESRMLGSGRLNKEMTGGRRISMPFVPNVVRRQQQSNAKK